MQSRYDKAKNYPVHYSSTPVQCLNTPNFFIPEDEEDGYFGQEQVPLTDEIKEILEEYPDGQIFKVSYVNSSYSKIINN